MPAVARFKVVCSFLVAVLAAMIVWGFLLRAFLPHHADNPAAQGLAAIT
jgi:predicted permease